MPKQRRSQGSGSIFQRSDGRWMAVVDYPGNRRGQPRRRKSFYAPTRDEAAAKLEDFLATREMTETPLFEEDVPRGTHTPQQWYDVLTSSLGVCFYCRKDVGINALTQNRKVPRVRGGSNDIENLAPACQLCNMAKSRLTDVEYIAFLVKDGKS